MQSFRKVAISFVATAFLAPATFAQDNLSGVQQSEWAESFDAQSFIARPVSSQLLVGEIGVDDDSHPLACRSLEAHPKRCMARVRGLNQSAAGYGQRLVDKVEQRRAMSATDVVDAVRERVIRWAGHVGDWGLG